MPSNGDTLSGEMDLPGQEASARPLICEIINKRYRCIFHEHH